jgi:hypothetical protein
MDPASLAEKALGIPLDLPLLAETLEETRSDVTEVLAAIFGEEMEGSASVVTNGGLPADVANKVQADVFRVIVKTLGSQKSARGRLTTLASLALPSFLKRKDLLSVIPSAFTRTQRVGVIESVIHDIIGDAVNEALQTEGHSSGDQPSLWAVTCDLISRALLGKKFFELGEGM